MAIKKKTFVGDFSLFFLIQNYYKLIINYFCLTNLWVTLRRKSVLYLSTFIYSGKHFFIFLFFHFLYFVYIYVTFMLFVTVSRLATSERLFTRIQNFSYHVRGRAYEIEWISVVKRVSVYTTLRQYVLRGINVAKKIGSAAKGERGCVLGTQQQGCS